MISLKWNIYIIVLPPKVQAGIRLWEPEVVNSYTKIVFWIRVASHMNIQQL